MILWKFLIHVQCGLKLLINRYFDHHIKKILRSKIMQIIMVTNVPLAVPQQLYRVRSQKIYCFSYSWFTTLIHIHYNSQTNSRNTVFKSVCHTPTLQTLPNAALKPMNAQYNFCFIMDDNPIKLFNVNILSSVYM